MKNVKNDCIFFFWLNEIFSQKQKKSFEDALTTARFRVVKNQK